MIYIRITKVEIDEIELNGQVSFVFRIEGKTLAFEINKYFEFSSCNKEIDITSLLLPLGFRVWENRNLVKEML